MEKHVLVVEDDSDILELVEYLLSANGLNVRGVGTAKKFWESLSTYTPDVIILDVMLPDGNGLELCMQLKSNDTTKDIPVVIMSANYTQRELDAKPCAQDFISKPFDVNEFVGKIQKQFA